MHLFQKVRFSLLLVVFMASLSGQAQRKCGVMPRSDMEITRFENWMQSMQFRRSLTQQRQSLKPPVYTIPVVIHIVYRPGELVGEGNNLSMDRIQDQIDRLNEDFRKANPRAAGGVPSVFQPVEADVEVEFILARQDPDGNPTNGVTRTQSGINVFQFPYGSLKSQAYWPSEDYLNIWVAETNGDEDGIIGHSTFPISNLAGIEGQGEDNPNLDGVVVDVDFFGTNPDTDGVFESYGQTLTHELGHFLGLRHVWGDGGCDQDDYCADTPAASEHHASNGDFPSAAPCTFEWDTCEEDELPDMFMNFMDYSDDACMNMFTVDQKSRMRIVLENSPRRESLLNSPGLTYPIGVVARDAFLADVTNVPLITCDEQIVPQLRLQNFGSETIQSLEIQVTVDEATESLSYSDLSLGTGAETFLNLPLGNLTEGDHVLSWTIMEVNGAPDENELNNSFSTSMVVDRQQLESPFRETFEIPEWTVTSPEFGEWAFTTEEGNSGYYVRALSDASFVKSWLVSPVFSLENYKEAGLFYDLSYGIRGDALDSLEVFVSSSCDSGFDLEEAVRLSELDFPNSVTRWVPIVPEDWNEYFLDLSSHIGEPEVRVAFVFTNYGGNDLYIDNIEITNNSNPEQPRLEPGSFVVYPNPARAYYEITLNLPDKQDILLQLIDPSGRVVYADEYENLLNETLRFQAPTQFGLYFIRLSGKNINQVQRILISR
jgi:hypothetical protein